MIPNEDSRKPVLVSSGPHYIGAALPHPDTDHLMTSLAGVRKRFTVKPPTINPGLLVEFKEFVNKWVRKELVPLAPDSDITVVNWLEHTNYPLWRREELLKTFDEMMQSGGPASVKNLFFNKSFGKKETYDSYKHFRAINSRTDEFKCLVGPIFRLIEKVLFSRPEFIKKIPVAERPRYIWDLLYREGVFFLQTDYTAFESLFVKDLMDACEMQLYEYMTSALPSGPSFMRLVRSAMLGTNTCVFKNFSVSLDATRMSGEMCTSLGNSFSNLMFLLFIAEKKGCQNVGAVIEGDDGLSCMTGNPPEPEDFAELGLVIKLVKFDNLNEASFCGLVFNQHDLINITDPRKVILSTPWIRDDYIRSKPAKLQALLRAKSMSLLAQYPGCPIVQELGKYGMRITRRYDSLMRKWITQSRMPQYEREKYISALEYYDHSFRELCVPTDTRFLMEKLFHISVDMQERIEDFFRNKHDLEPYTLPFFSLGTRDQISYYDLYVNIDKRDSPNLNYPALRCARLSLHRDEFEIPEIGKWVDGKGRIVKGRRKTSDAISSGA